MIQKSLLSKKFSPERLHVAWPRGGVGERGFCPAVTRAPWGTGRELEACGGGRGAWRGFLSRCVHFRFPL